MKSKAVVVNLRCALPKGSVIAQNPAELFAFVLSQQFCCTVCERLENNR